MDDSQLEIETSVTLLNRLREVTYPVAADVHYDKGHDLYGDGKYEEALMDLHKAMVFNPTDVNAVYFTARAYHRLDDNENAAIYYGLVISDFPDSSRINDAKKYLAQVQE